MRFNGINVAHIDLFGHHFNQVARRAIARLGKRPPTRAGGAIYWDAVRNLPDPKGPTRPMLFTDIDLAGEVADAFDWHHGGHESSCRRISATCTEYRVWSKGSAHYNNPEQH